MLKPRLSALLLLLAAIPCVAQRHGFVAPLDIMVVLEGQREPYTHEITVTLQDDWGDIEGVQTTTRGFVQFLVGTGLHRLTIRGPEIEAYYDEFTLYPGPSSIRTIQVEPKRSLSASKQKQSAEPVDSTRLQVPRKAENEFARARSAMEKKNWQQAASHLQKAIGLYPQYDRAYAALGELELQAGDRAAGRRNLEAAIRLNPNNAEACRGMAEILVAENKYAEAEPLLQASLRKHPADAWALSYAALGELVQGRLQEAVATAQKVHSLPHQAFASAHLIAARALESLHRLGAAAAEYQLYLAEAPNGGNAERARAALQRLSLPAAIASQN